MTDSTPANPMRQDKFAGLGLTFDDVLLIPAESNVVPAEVSTRTRIAADIELNIPLLSAAMDTVTEARLAIAIAREGGLGIIHRNLSIEEQAAEVDKVKRSESGMIVEPVTLGPNEPVAAALAVMERYHISGVPITESDGKLVGILTNRDLRFIQDEAQQICDVMTKENLITAPVGTTLEEAEETLESSKGIITRKISISVYKYRFDVQQFSPLLCDHKLFLSLGVVQEYTEAI